MTAQLRLYDGAGVFVAVLPDFLEAAASEELGPGEGGAWSASYAPGGQDRDKLVAMQDGQLAVLEDGQELYRGLFEDDSDDDANPLEPLAVSGRGLKAVLERALVYPQGGAGTLPASHAFVTATPGTILGTLLTKAQGRGCLPGLVWTFSGAVDSAGVPWPQALTVTYDATVNLLDVASGLEGQGVVELRMVGVPGGGYELQAYVAGTVLARDRPDVVLHLGREGKSLPRQRSRREIASHVLVVGDADANAERANATTLAAYGRREVALTQGNTTEAGTMAVLGDAALADRAQPKLGRTLEYDLAAGAANTRPWQDYRVGDKVRVAGVRTSGTGQLEPLRVRTMACSWTPDGPGTPSVELGDLFLEASIALARRIDGVVNGSVVTTPAGGTAAPATDTLAPAAPATVSLTTAAYQTADGTTLGTVTASWPQVTTNSDGSACTDLDHYLVGFLVNGAWWGGVVSTWSLSLNADGLRPGSTVVAYVLSVDKSGNYGGITTSAAVVVANDATPPPTPSAPTITTGLGIVRAAWDGLGSAGEPMPADFVRLEVHASTTGAGFAPTPATQVDQLQAAGVAPLTGIPYGTTMYVRLVAVDASGNRSAPSAAGSGMPEQVDLGDLPDQLLTAAKLVDGAVDATKLAAGAVTQAKLAANAVTAAAIAAGAVGTAAISAGAVGTGQLAANAVDATKLADGAVAEAKLAVDAVSARVIAAGAIGSVALAGNAVTAAKIAAGAVGTAALAGAAVDATKLADSAVTTAKLAAAAVTAGQLAAGAVDSTKLLDGAVIAAKLGAAAVTSAALQDGAVATAKLAAGAVTSAQLGTDAVDARVLASGAVDAPAIAASAVTAAAIAANAVTAGAILAGAVTTGALAAGAVTAGKVAADAITAGTIAADAITARELAANSVTANELAANSVQAGAIAAGQVTTAALAAGAVTAATIAAGAVQTANLAAGAVTTGTLAAGAVTATQLAAGAVVAGKLAADAVTAGTVAADAVTARELAAGSVTTAELAAGAVVAGKIAAGAVTAGTIAADAVTATEIAAGAITAAELSAGAVTANALNVTMGGGNLLPDSSFEGTGALTWGVSNGATSAARSAAGYGRQGGTSHSLAVVVPAANNYAGATTNLAGLIAGRPYVFSCWVYPTTALALNFAPDNLNVTGNSLGGAGGLDGYTPPVNTWTRLWVKGVLAAGQTTVQLYVRTSAGQPAGTFYVDDVQAEEGDVVTAYAPRANELLPGTIVANMLAADSVTAAAIAAGNVTAGKLGAGAVVAGTVAAGAVTAGTIAAGAVVAGTIAADAVTAATIAAGQVTAGKIATDAVTANTVAAGAISVGKLAAGTLDVGNLTAGNLVADVTLAARIKTANSGQRVELSSVGLQAFDTGGTRTVFVDASNGAAVFAGTLSTATTGPRIEIGSGSVSMPYGGGGTANGSNVRWQNPGGPNGANGLGPQIAGIVLFGGDYEYLVVQSELLTGTGAHSELVLYPTSAQLRYVPTTNGSGSSPGIVKVDSTGTTITSQGAGTKVTINTPSLYMPSGTADLPNLNLQGTLDGGAASLNGAISLGTTGELIASSMGTGNNLSSGKSHLYLTGSSVRLGCGTSAGLLYVQTITSAAYRPIFASAFTVQSALASKTNTADAKAGKLAKVRQLKPLAYNKRDEPNTRRLGVAAEQLAQLLPEAAAYHVDDAEEHDVWVDPADRSKGKHRVRVVPGASDSGTGEAGELFGVDLYGLTTAVLAGLQELADQVDALEARLPGKAGAGK